MSLSVFRKLYPCVTVVCLLGWLLFYGQCLEGNHIVTQLYLVYKHSWAVSVLRPLSSLQQELETFSLLSNGTSINLSNQVEFASCGSYC